MLKLLQIQVMCRAFQFLQAGPAHLHSFFLDENLVTGAEGLIETAISGLGKTPFELLYHHLVPFVTPMDLLPSCQRETSSRYGSASIACQNS
jgi:hypothetical protein